MYVYESESEREREREGSTRENNFIHSKLLAGIQGAAIHGAERERGGRGEKVGFYF
jgi:hypothetical protein